MAVCWFLFPSHLNGKNFCEAQGGIMSVLRIYKGMVPLVSISETWKDSRLQPTLITLEKSAYGKQCAPRDVENNSGTVEECISDLPSIQNHRSEKPRQLLTHKPSYVFFKENLNTGRIHIQQVVQMWNWHSHLEFEISRSKTALSLHRTT